MDSKFIYQFILSPIPMEKFQKIIENSFIKTIIIETLFLNLRLESGRIRREDEPTHNTAFIDKC